MTTTNTVNYAIVVGTIEPKDRQRPRRNGMRASVTDIRMQLLTPFGAPFVLPITLAGAVESSYKLTPGKKIAVEGYVRMERGFDRRFASEEALNGTQTREMQFIATQVRDATEEEPTGSSFVTLTGTVLDPPVFVAHPQYPGTRLALVRFGVTQERPSPYPGSAIVRRDRYQVNVAVQTDAPDAGLLYRPGNAVRLEGELDCVLVELRERNGQQTAAMERVRERLNVEQQGVPADEQSYQAYLRQLRRYATTPRWRVLAGHIESAGEAQAITEPEARTLRRQLMRVRDEDQRVLPTETVHNSNEATSGDDTE